MGRNTLWSTPKTLYWILFCLIYFKYSIPHSDFASYADDNTIYYAGDNIDDVTLSLKESSTKLFKWFTANQMKCNTDKCYLIVTTGDTTEMQVWDSVIKNSSCVKR